MGTHLFLRESLRWSEECPQFGKGHTISTIKVNVVVIEMFTDKKIVIGRKQTLRALSRDEAQTVYLAKDVDLHVTKDIAELCKEKNIEIIYCDSMKELGKLAGIGVNAAAAAVLK
jgi:large subunit ribosomal protein L7A